MKTVELGEVAKYVRNGKSIKNSSDGVGLPITRIETISDGDVNTEKLGYGAVSDHNVIGDYWLEDGDILMSHINSPKHLGKSALFEKADLNIVHGMNLLCIRPKKDFVLPEYLNYYFNSRPFRSFIFSISNQSVNQASFGATKLRKAQIPLPSLSEQKAIVAKLDRAQRLIDIDKAILTKYDQLIQSVFLEMFGDLRSNEKGFEKLTIDDISEKVTDGDHKTPNRTETGIMLLSARNIKNGYIDLEEKVDHIPQEEYDRMINRCLPEFGDILISCSGTIGRVTKVNIHEPFNMVRSVALVKPTKEKINSTYLESMLQSEYLQSEMTKSANTSSQSNLFLGPIKKLPVVLPPLGLQKEFEKNINRIRVEKSKTENSLLKSEALFSSLVQEVFG